jgi:hypothetical protein
MLRARPALNLGVAAAAVYLWLTVLSPFVFGPAPLNLRVSTPISKPLDHTRPATKHIEPAPFWD